jgi:hypothetical protein
MKKLRRAITISLSLVLFFSTIVYAAPLEGATTKNLSTNYTVVNLGSTTATVLANYYKPDGSVWDADNANESFTVAGNFGQKVIAQYFDTTLSSGYGSVVLSSDQPLGAVVQILARNQTPTSGAYSGIVTPSEKFYVPQANRKLATQNGVANTQFMIQNADSTDVTVTVDLIPYPGSGLSGYQKSNVTIKPGATFLYDLADESAANVPDGWYGSAVVTAQSGKKIAVVVNIFIGSNALQTFNAFAQEQVASEWSVPLFTSRLLNKLSTPVVVQNLSGSDLAVGAVSLNCKSSSFTPATFSLSNTAVVPNTASYAFNPVTDLSFPDNWSGSCRVVIAGSASGVVYVQMRKPGATYEFAAYEAIPSNSTDTTVIVPLVSKRQANGFATAVTIQNLSAAQDAVVKLTYQPAAAYVSSGGSATPLVFENVTIAPDGNQVENQRLPNGVAGMPDGWYGTLIVEPQNPADARPLGAFVQLTNYLPSFGDTLMAHDAFTLP